MREKRFGRGCPAASRTHIADGQTGGVHTHADPGQDTVQSYTIHWGDGSDSAYSAVELAALDRQVPHTYADGLASHTITVDLADEDGTFTSLSSKAITVTSSNASMVR